MTNLQKAQEALGVVADDVWGPKSQAALDAEIAASLARRGAVATSGKFDDRSEKNLATLLPKVQARARAFLARAIAEMTPHGVTVKIISGTRTYAEQDALYAKGRTAPGPKVTNAKAGQSNHNFGVAFDIGLFRGADYLESSPLYALLGPVGEAAGLEWGGRWTSLRDEPHYQYPHGLTMGELRSRKAAGMPII